MQIIKAKDYKTMCEIAANIISTQMLVKNDSVLGLATGSTPIGVYENLVDKYQKGIIDFKNIKTINLDEYCGLEDDNENSYHYFMNYYLFNKVNIDKVNIYIPNGNAKDIKLECNRYENIIDSFESIDIQILGIGHNGHIGFNEPSDEFINHVHQVNLSFSSINANKRFFNSIEEVPTKAITMGIKDIMKAKTILLLVSGKDKNEIIKESLFGNITPQVPASILQLHNNLIVIGDEEALRGI